MHPFSFSAAPLEPERCRDALAGTGLSLPPWDPSADDFDIAPDGRELALTADLAAEPQQDGEQRLLGRVGAAASVPPPQRLERTLRDLQLDIDLQGLDAQSTATLGGIFSQSCRLERLSPELESLEETLEDLRLREFVLDFGVGVVGGCCGTTPDHIGAIGNAVAPLAPRSVNAGVFYKEAA